MGGALGRWTTAAGRERYWWRPGGRWRARGRAGRGHGGGLRRRAGLGAAQEGERARGAALQRPEFEETVRRRGNRGADRRLKMTGLICKFQKFQGPVCKPAITFKLGLKRKSVQNESCKTFQALQLCFRV
jgi:hypothetical protein